MTHLQCQYVSVLVASVQLAHTWCITVVELIANYFETPQAANPPL